MLEDQNNPLDSAEDFLEAQQWTFDRLSDDQLFFTVQGDRGTYRVLFVWDENQRALQYCCEMDVRIPQSNSMPTYRILSDLNSKLWLGHFDLNQDEDEDYATPCYRYTSLMYGGSHRDHVMYMRELITFSLQECERLYDVFCAVGDSQFVHASEQMGLALAEAAGHC